MKKDFGKNFKRKKLKTPREEIDLSKIVYYLSSKTPIRTHITKLFVYLNLKIKFKFVYHYPIMIICVYLYSKKESRNKNKQIGRT